ncbi:hypothetical protein [Niveispirillum sp.]|uniref:hypothetical protein n=1 Tax=Niveispirillum sp. TaxID=1917217 RepID=UPI001B6D4A01|nr:hypothetical protein [Niveispirillum sp.]MBP7339317.1 hypothetical protein [Niveispirillum sp.]
MAAGRLTGRLGLLFAALSGVGTASIVGELLRALPQASAIAAENPMILVAAPMPIGAVVAIAHIFWLRSVQAKLLAKREQPAAPVRTLVPPPDDGEGGGKPPRWRPVIRN